MATAQNELSALISKTVEEQTFSLDAVKAIGAIRDRAVVLEVALAAAEKLASDRQALLVKRDEALAEHAANQSALKAREAAVAEREKVMTNLEKGTAVAQAQFAVLDSAFKAIFANRQIREQTITTAPIATQMPGGGSYVTNYDTRNTIDRTEG